MENKFEMGCWKKDMYNIYMVYQGVVLPQKRNYNINEFSFTSLDIGTPSLFFIDAIDINYKYMKHTH